MKSNFATRTVIRQILAFLTSLTIGLVIIKVLVGFADSFGPYHFSAGGEFGFGLSWFFNGLGLVAIIVLLTLFHHDEGGSPSEIFQFSLTTTLFVGGFFVLLQIIPMSLGALLLTDSTSHDFVLILSGAAFSAIVFVILGLSVGGIQAAYLSLMGISNTQYQKVIDNQTNLEACRAGRLPPHYRVGIFWKSTLSLALGVVALSALVFWITFYDEGLAGLIFGILLCAAFLIFGAFQGTRNLKVLLWPQLMSVEGKISKSTEERPLRYSSYTVYVLYCNRQKYEATPKLWTQIIEDREYRLWFARYDKKIIAYEECFLGNHLAQRNAA